MPNISCDLPRFSSSDFDTRSPFVLSASPPPSTALARVSVRGRPDGGLICPATVGQPALCLENATTSHTFVPLYGGLASKWMIFRHLNYKNFAVTSGMGASERVLPAQPRRM